MSSLRAPRLFAAVSALVLSAVGAVSPAVAQQGYVYFQQHIGQSDYTLTPARLYQHQANGTSTEISQLGFPAGTYTLDSMEVVHGTECRYMVTNVTFTIVAGKVTPVTVTPVPTTCRAMASPRSRQWEGQGTIWVYTKGAGNPFTTSVIECHIVDHLGYLGHFRLTGQSHCDASFPYGDSIRVTQVPDTGSINLPRTAFTPVVADTVIQVTDGYSFWLGGAFQGPNQSFVTETDTADIGLVRTGGQSGPFFNYTTFTVTNHGAHRAGAIRFKLFPPVASPGIASNVVGWDLGIAGCGAFPELYYSCLVNLDPGQSVTLRVALAAVPTAVPTSNTPTPTGSFFCTAVAVDFQLTNVTDPNPANNSAPCTQDSVTVSVGAGGHMPGGATVTKGAADVPVLAFTLTPTVAAQTLNSIQLTAAGTGNSQLDITAVKLYADLNSDGALDAGDSLLATGTYASNGGAVTLPVSPAFALAGPTDFLVTYSFNLTIAQKLGGGVTLAALPFLFLPMVRRRRSTLTALLLLMIAGAGVAACGGSDAAGPGGNAGTATYSAQLTGVNISGVDLPGVSVSGPTITIQK